MQSMVKFVKIKTLKSSLEIEAEEVKHGNGFLRAVFSLRWAHRTEPALSHVAHCFLLHHTEQLLVSLDVLKYSRFTPPR